MAREPFARALRGLAVAVDLCGSARRPPIGCSAAGFTEIETWLEDRPTPMEDGRRFLETVSWCAISTRCPPELRDPFVDDVIGQLSEPLVLDYVRLNMRARRA